MKLEAEGREWGRGSWRGGSKLKVLGRAVRSPGGVWGGSPTALDARRAQKTRLVAANVV